ncbi:MAG: beta-propeller domain-containing protein [Oligoflexia bacterium]|nr:beta-propeller domain-containing protein [Oligoflexia bacterium]
MRKKTSFSYCSLFGKQILTLLLVCGISVPVMGASSYEKALNPAPESPDTIAAQLSRYYGQTKFLNPMKFYYRDLLRAAPVAAEKVSQDEGGQRSVQESDVYKVGKKDSKLLYLLNNYRGLQIVSFKDGINTPKLLGRSEASGNWVSNMYYHEASDRILSLENASYDRLYPYGLSKILVYNVSNVDEPKTVQEIAIPGRIMDSRMVGEVLYVASVEKDQGKVTAFSLREQPVRMVDEFSIKARMAYGELMNIVEQFENGHYRYYLLSVLEKDYRNWNERAHQVMVVDISSELGKIKPLMIASLKGTIRERSQAFVKEGHLIAVSNYQPSNNSRQRIAVESFKIRAAEISTDKSIAHDFEINVGSSEDLNASIQEVRVEKDQLYVFWVPQNLIDPLDVFDLSTLSTDSAVIYKGRLSFDGWIQRAFPISYRGERYIVGLGYIIPTVNNENNRSYPQTMLFKITNAPDGSISKEVVAQMTFSPEKRLWTDFNAADKMMEFRFDPQSGLGTILFQAYRWTSNGNSGGSDAGGKLIGLDLNKSEVFQEGGYLRAQKGWLKRVFQNSEIDRINSFSDQALSTYDVSGNIGIIGDHHKIFSAISTLELSRNIVDYQLFEDENRQSFGLQVISPEAYFFYYSGNSEDNYTELRVVKIDRADSEQQEVVKSLKIKGRYVDMLKQSPREFLLLTKENLKVAEKYLTKNYISLVTFASENKATIITKEVVSTSDQQKKLGRYALSDGNEKIEVIGGRVWLILGDNKLFEASITNNGSDLNLQQIDLSKCSYLSSKQNAQEIAELSLKVLAGEPYIAFNLKVKDPEKEGIFYLRNFIMQLYSEGGGSWNCKTPINIPGHPFRIVDNLLLTLDYTTTETAPVPRPIPGGIEEDNAMMSRSMIVPPRFIRGNDDLASLRLELGSKASLQDIYETNKIVENQILFLKEGSKKMVCLEREDRSNHVAFFTYLDVDANFRFVKDSYRTDSALSNQQMRLTKVVSVKDGSDDFYLLFRSGFEVRIGKINAVKNQKVAAISLVEVDPLFNKSEKKAMIKVHSYMDGEENIHYTPSQRSMEIIEGYYGIKQFYLE